MGPSCFSKAIFRSLWTSVHDCVIIREKKDIKVVLKSLKPSCKKCNGALRCQRSVGCQQQGRQVL